MCFDSKGFKMIFYFEKKKIIDISLLCNYNKQKSRSIIELCELHLPKIVFCCEQLYTALLSVIPPK